MGIYNIFIYNLYFIFITPCELIFVNIKIGIILNASSYEKHAVSRP